MLNNQFSPFNTSFFLVAVPTLTIAPTVGNQKQQELQSRILSILNSKTASIPSATVAAPAAALAPIAVAAPVAAAPTQAPLLNDPNVQKALDSLMQGDLLRKISGGQRF